MAFTAEFVPSLPQGYLLMKTLRITVLVVLVAALGGCTSLWNGGLQQGRQGSSSSLVDFLYPDGSVPAEAPKQLPYLELPLSVGIAFVPGNSSYALPASEQHILLERVAAAFRDRPYVASIEVIPESYLRSARGVRGMQQVAGMFNVDVMALVSHDQLALSSERDSALLYWTVVGALLVKGNVNDVQTMIDTAVFDVDSTRLLFRAPGTHRDSANATMLEAERDLRGLQQRSLSIATDDMIVNLNHELERFREQVKEGQRAEVAWQAGRGGGGSSGWLFLALAAFGLLRSALAARCP